MGAVGGEPAGGELLFVMNRNDLLGEFKNGTVGNILGGIIVLFATFLAVHPILLAFGIIG